MFNILPLEPSKRIALFQKEEFTVSTVTPSDTNEPETAVEHPDYNNGKWVIVEEYKSIGDAKIGHEKWVKAMTAEILPEILVDVSSSPVKQFLEMLSPEEVGIDSVNERIKA